MKDIFRIYKQSFFNTATSKIFWFVFGLSCFMMFFFIFFMPFILFFSMKNVDAGFGANQTIMMTSTILVPFFAAFISEINASPNERIFILSRPITRRAYLTSKFLASLTFSSFALLLSVLCVFFAYIFFNTQTVTHTTPGIIIGVPGVDPIPPKTTTYNFAKLAFQNAGPWELSLNLLVLTIFGTVIGQCYCIYFREAIPSILVMLVTMIYTMAFSVFSFTQQNISEIDPNKWIYRLQFIYLPLGIFGVGAVVFYILSFYFNKKIDDGK